MLKDLLKMWNNYQIMVATGSRFVDVLRVAFSRLFKTYKELWVWVVNRAEKQPVAQMKEESQLNWFRYSKNII